MDLVDFSVGPHGGPVDPNDLRSAIERLSGQNASGYDLLKVIAAKTRSRVVMGRGSNPSIYLEAGSELIPLPLFHQGQNVIGIQGGLYGGVKRLYKNTRVPRNAYAQYERLLTRMGNADLGDPREALDTVRKNLLKWRQRATEQIRNVHGGIAEPYWMGQKVRVEVGNLDPRVRRHVDELISLEEQTVKNLRGLKRNRGGQLEPAVVANLAKATELRERIAQSAQEVYGLHTGIKNLAVKKRGQKKLGYLEFTERPIWTYGLDPFASKLGKGIHQRVRLQDMGHLDTASSRLPALVDPYFMERQEAAAGFQRLRGIKAQQTLTVGDKTIGYFASDVPVNVGLLSVSPNAPAEVRSLINQLGDSSVFTSSIRGRNLARRSMDARVSKRILVSHAQQVRSEGYAVMHPMLRDILQHSPGRHLNLSITRDSLDEYWRDLLRTANPQANPEKIEEMLGQIENRHVLATSVMEDGTLGRRVVLGKNQTVTQLDAGQAGTYITKENLRARTSETGVRGLVGNVRMSVAGDLAGGRGLRVGGARIDLLTLQNSMGGGASPYLSHLAERIRLVENFDTRKSLMDALSEAMGGQTLVSKISDGSNVGDYVSASYGKEFVPGSGAEVLTKFLENVKTKFGTTNPEFVLPGNVSVPLAKLMAPSSRHLTEQEAAPIAAFLSANQQDRGRLAKLISEHVNVELLHTTYANRASQPGFKMGKGAVRMTFGTTMNIFEQTFSPKLFTPAERRMALMGRLSPTGSVAKDAAIKVWNSMQAGTKRGIAVMTTFKDMLLRDKFGDDALREELAKRSQAPMSLAEFRQAYKNRIEATTPGTGGWVPDQLQGTPFHPGHEGGPIWVDTGVEGVSRGRGKYAPKTRLVPVFPGRAIGARSGGILRKGKNVNINGESTTLVDESVKLYNALLDPTVDPTELHAMASRQAVAFGESVGGKKGLVNRGFFSGQKYQMSGALLPYNRLRPGEVGIYEGHLEQMGLSAEEIAQVRRGEGYGVRITHPSYSYSHTPYTKIVALSKAQLKDKGINAPNQSAIFMHPFDLPSIERDFDADRGAVAFTPELFRETRLLRESSGAVERSTYARKVVQNVMGFSDASVYQSQLKKFGGLVMEKEAAAAATRAVPGGATGIAHTVMYGIHNMVADISRGAELTDLGLDPNKMPEAQAALERIRGLVSGERGAEVLRASSRTASTGTYAYLAKGSEEAGLVGRYITSLLSNHSLSDEGIDEATKAQADLMDMFRNKKAMSDLPIVMEAGRVASDPTLLRSATEAQAAAAYLASKGARSAISGTRSLAESPTVNHIIDTGKAFGFNVPEAEARATMANVGQMAEGQTLEDVSRLGNQTGKFRQWIASGKLKESFKGLIGTASEFLQKNKWAKWGLGTIGAITAVRALTSGSDEPEAPQIYSGGGAPLPPPPVMSGPQGGLPDFGIMNRNQVGMQRPYGVSSHPQVQLDTNEDTRGYQDLAAGAYGVLGKNVVQSGTVRDMSNRPSQRQDIEYEINRQLHSSF